MADVADDEIVQLDHQMSIKTPATQPAAKKASLSK
jgi:hypothetical protein